MKLSGNYILWHHNLYIGLYNRSKLTFLNYDPACNRVPRNILVLHMKT